MQTQQDAAVTILEVANVELEKVNTLPVKRDLLLEANGAQLDAAREYNAAQRVAAITDRDWTI